MFKTHHVHYFSIPYKTALRGRPIFIITILQMRTKAEKWWFTFGFLVSWNWAKVVIALSIFRNLDLASIFVDQTLTLSQVLDRARC